MAKIGNHNRRKGFGYEHRFVSKRKAEGAKRVKRHYGSLGATDVEWIDALGFKNEAQLKFSTVKLPKVSEKDRRRLRAYANRKKKTKIWIVCKVSRGAEIWEALN